MLKSMIEKVCQGKEQEETVVVVERKMDAAAKCVSHANDIRSAVLNMDKSFEMKVRRVTYSAIATRRLRELNLAPRAVGYLLYPLIKPDQTTSRFKVAWSHRARCACLELNIHQGITMKSKSPDSDTLVSLISCAWL